VVCSNTTVHWAKTPPATASRRVPDRHRAEKTRIAVWPVFPEPFDLYAGIAYVYECSQYGNGPALNHLHSLCEVLVRYPDRIPGDGPIPEPVIHEETWSLLIRATLAEVFGSRAAHWTLTPLDEPWVVMGRPVRPVETPEYLARLNVWLSDDWRVERRVAAL
jgi:hypothetical protein